MRARGQVDVAADEAILSVENVSLAFGGVKALGDVSFDIRKGEIRAIIGPNGAGKTTLLQVAATLLKPSLGTVEVLGEPLHEADIADLRTRIGMSSAAVADRVPLQEKVIDLVLTAAYGILGRNTEDYDSDDVTRAVELLDALGCAHLIRRRFASLSEGERKRVQIARSLMADPELLLLDEPSQGLAPLLVKEVFQIIQAMRKEGIAVLLVEQNVRVSLAIADRAYVLEKGQLQWHGRMADLAKDVAGQRRLLSV